MTDKSAYSAGDTVTMSATLTNAGGSDCSFGQGAEHGFSVSQNGQTVWAAGCGTSPDGHTGPSVCPQFEQLVHLAPGQTMTRSQAWSQQADGSAPAQVPAGSYQANEAWGGQTATATLTIS